jgi:hypothetical protein
MIFEEFHEGENIHAEHEKEKLEFTAYPKKH